MKKLVLLLVVALSSCSKDEDVCGTVTGRNVQYGNENVYTLQIDGVSKTVPLEVYSANKIGSYICL